MKNTPLRDWSTASYSSIDGRAAKSSEGPQRRYSADGENWSVDAQFPKAAGCNGAPAVNSLSKCGSADPGRRKWAR